MQFNSSKFQLVLLGDSQVLKKETRFFNSNHKDMIHPVDIVRDLGVMVDDLVNFKAQILKATTKAKEKAA